MQFPAGCFHFETIRAGRTGRFNEIETESEREARGSKFTEAICPGIPVDRWNYCLDIGLLQNLLASSPPPREFISLFPPFVLSTGLFFLFFFFVPSYVIR